MRNSEYSIEIIFAAHSELPVSTYIIPTTIGSVETSADNARSGPRWPLSLIIEQSGVLEEWGVEMV